MRLVYAIFILLLTSCSANWHLKQAIAKNPSILQSSVVVVVDTLIVTDSVHLVDTFYANDIDTMYVHDSGVNVTIYKYRNRYIVKTKIKSDTIRLVKKIQLPPVIKYEPKKEHGFAHFMALFSIFFCLFAIILHYAKKMGNP